MFDVGLFIVSMWGMGFDEKLIQKALNLFTFNLKREPFARANRLHSPFASLAWSVLRRW